MVPVLLALNGVIWYGVLRGYQYDRSIGPYPENPQFDIDLDKLWEQGMQPFNQPVITKLKEDDDLLLKQNFEAWVERERHRDNTLEDYLWQEGILNPEEVIWCNGTPLTPYDPDDMKKFMEIKNKALLEDEYNSKPLNDGGYHDLYKAWFMLKGCSDFGAEKLLELDIKPWEFDFD